MEKTTKGKVKTKQTEVVKKTNNKIKNNHLFLIIIGVIAICLITFGSTYAFFTLVVSSDNDDVVANSGKLDISYIKEGDLTDQVLYGTSDYRNGLNTSVKIKTNAGSLAATVGIYLKIKEIGQDLISSSLRWAVYKNGASIPIKYGDFSTIPADKIIQIVDDFDVRDEYDEFRVYVWLDGETSTNDMQNESFSATIYASANYISGEL